MVEQRGINTSAIEIRWLRPFTFDIFRGHDKVIRVPETTAHVFDIGIDEIKFSGIVAEAWRIDSAGIRIPAHVQLTFSLQGMRNQPPVFEIV